MLTSTDKSFLMHKTSSNWTKLIDIKEYPDLGAAPDALDASDLTSPKTVAGRQSLEAMTFPANYDLEVYKTIKAMEGTEMEMAVWFGGTQSGEDITPTGEYGKFRFKGQLSIRVTGAGTDEVRGMEVTIAPSQIPYLDTEAGA